MATAEKQLVALAREQVRDMALQAKEQSGLTWEQIGKELGKNQVYAAMLIHGYGQATPEEAKRLGEILDLGPQAQKALCKAPFRVPEQPWPPTDPFIYRLYEVVMLYGPVFKEIAHEKFGDGIMSAIDMSVEIKKLEEDGVERMELVLNGKWLKYKRF